MNNKYILLRHGETRYQAKKLDALYTKDENPDLSITENGKEKIKIVAKELKNKGIDLIYSSDYFRTKQTSEIVAKELGLDVKFDSRLIDTNFGVFHGKTGKEYRKFFSDTDKKERFFKRSPKGENWRNVRERVAAVITEIEKEHNDRTILIVSHADPVWLLAGYLKGLSEDELLEQRHVEGFWPDVGQYFEIK